MLIHLLNACISVLPFSLTFSVLHYMESKQNENESCGPNQKDCISIDVFVFKINLKNSSYHQRLLLRSFNRSFSLRLRCFMSLLEIVLAHYQEVLENNSTQLYCSVSSSNVGSFLESIPSNMHVDHS